MQNFPATEQPLTPRAAFIETRESHTGAMDEALRPQLSTAVKMPSLTGMSGSFARRGI
jgi:hypothetical protein